MRRLRLLGRDGSVWTITAGPTGKTGARQRRRSWRMPDWLDRLIDWAIGRLISLAQWNRWP